jgi:phage gp36-like protein
MAYTTQARIETAIPAQHLVDALDDDGDGMPDGGVLTEILASADQAVDAFLAGLFAVPFVAPAPAAVCEAAFVFACERIYDRRQILDKNPWSGRADDWRKRLEEIGSGKLALDAGLEKSFTPGAVVTETARVDGSMG